MSDIYNSPTSFPASQRPSILSGAAAVQAAAGIEAQAKAAAVLTDWQNPPAASRQVFQQNWIPAPPQGIQALVLAYKVPDSMQFVLNGLVFAFNGAGGWVPGDFVFTLDVNLPIGSLSAQGVAFTGFGAVQTTLGLFACPWPVKIGEGDKLKASDIMRVKVTNNNITPGLPNIFTAILVGYTMPRQGNR